MRHLSCATGQPLPRRCGARGHAAARGYFRHRRFRGAAWSWLKRWRAAQPGHHAGGAALRIGGRQRRSHALRLYRARAGGHGRGRIPGPPHAGVGSARSRRSRAHPLRPQGRAGADQRHHHDDRRRGAAVGGCASACCARCSARWRSRSKPCSRRHRAFRRRGCTSQGPSRPDRRGGVHARACWPAQAIRRHSGGQSCYSLRCVPQGLGQVWEALEDGARPSSNAKSIPPTTIR